MCQLCDCDVEPPRSNQLGEGEWGKGGYRNWSATLSDSGIKVEEKDKTHSSGSLEIVCQVLPLRFIKALMMKILPLMSQIGY